MKKVMIILGITLFLFGMMPGCKERNEEEKVGELLEQLSKAKNESEERRIEKKIEELTERQRKREKESIREVELKIGESVVYEKWIGYGSKSELQTRFSVIFKPVLVSEKVPWNEMFREKKGKKYLIVYACVENLGPQKSIPSFYGRPEVKAANGSVYEAYVSLYKKNGLFCSQYA